MNGRKQPKNNVEYRAKAFYLQMFMCVYWSILHVVSFEMIKVEDME